MANFLHEYMNHAHNCYLYQRKKLNYFNDAIIKRIIDVTTFILKKHEKTETPYQDESEFDIIHTLCFRAMFSKKDEFIKTIHGYKLIQNEAC